MTEPSKEAMEIWERAVSIFLEEPIHIAGGKAAALVIQEALAERDAAQGIIDRHTDTQHARIIALEAALKPFVDAVSGMDLSREHDENRVAILFRGKTVVRETSVIVAHFTRALAALEARNG